MVPTPYVPVPIIGGFSVSEAGLLVRNPRVIHPDYQPVGRGRNGAVTQPSSSRTGTTIEISGLSARVFGTDANERITIAHAGFAARAVQL